MHPNAEKPDARLLEKRFLSVDEAATLLGLSRRTLDNYRVLGTGPTFHKFGRLVRYSMRDLEHWTEARREITWQGD